MFALQCPHRAGHAELLLVAVATVEGFGRQIAILLLQIIFRLLGIHHHGTADGIGAMQGGAGPLGHLNLFDVIEIEVEATHLVIDVVGAKAVTDAHPILDQQDTVATDAAHADVLRSPGRAGDRDTGDLAKHMSQLAGDLTVQLFLSDDGDGAGDIGEFLLYPLPGDNDGVVAARLLHRGKIGRASGGT